MLALLCIRTYTGYPVKIRPNLNYILKKYLKIKIKYVFNTLFSTLFHYPTFKFRC